MNSQVDDNLVCDDGSTTDLSPVHVRAFVDSDSEKWDAYVEAHPEATFFHKCGWREVLTNAFGHASHYLLAEHQGQICGVLPLAEIKSRLFGHALISTPFCVYGGALADNEKVRQLLDAEACRLAEELDVSHLELRNRQPCHPDWPTKSMYVWFRKELADDETNLKAIPRKQRAVVRKGIKSDLTAHVHADIDSFFTAYATSVRNLGTPVFSKRYFKELKRVFADEMDILSIKHEDQTVSSVMSFYFRDEILPYYGGGTAEARAFKSNDLMYWELMRHAVQKGVRWFDYGRSKVGSGSYGFKKNWGFEPEPLYYEYHLVRASKMPEINPNNPKYAMFINLWRKLPLSVANLIGPILSRNLG